MNNPGVVDSNQKIVGSGLLLNIDAAQRRSYPTTGTTWTDLSGNNRNGTLTNSPTYSSTNGGIFSFSTNQYINFGNTLDNDGTSPFSVSVWFRNTSTLTGVQVLASKQIISPPYTGWNFSFNPTATLAGVGRLQIEMVTNTTQIMRINTSTTYNNGNWYNAVFTYNGSKTRAGMLLYINGSLISTNGTDSASVTNTMSNAANYEIGARNGANQPYYGDIANAIHYNRALSATEVLNNFNALRSRFGYGSIVTNGMVLYADASNSASYSGSGTTWNDLSGNNNTGTLTNGPTFDSANGGSILFDGTNDYADFGNASSLNITGAITVTAWIKVASQTAYKGIVDKGRDNYGGWALCINDTTTPAVSFKVRISGTNRIITASTNYGNNIWTYVAGVFNGTTLSIYQNGVLSNSASYSGTIGTNSISVRAGAANDGLYFPGNIANVQIYNTGLSASEVLQNYYAQRPRF